jgi:pimeloyl-ACP methyl ester carboxylesterase
MRLGKNRIISFPIPHIESQNARLHIIPGAGHGFKLEEQRESLEQIKRYIENKGM